MPRVFVVSLLCVQGRVLPHLPVCAQRNLVPVTQLYVSVDASTEQSLKKIDRPLFKDFWPRFLNSLRALSEKVHVPPLQGILRCAHL